jgi:anti-anti-sigma factor
MTGTIEDMSLIGHACLIPDSDEHLWEATAAWVAGGIAAGERVVYFEDETAPALLGRLSDDRVCVRDAIEDGQFVIVPTEQTRAVLAQPIEHIEQVIIDQIDASAADGWPGLRLAGESGQGMLRPAGLASVSTFERALDELLLGHPTARLLCRYDRRWFDDVAIAEMRAVHETELVTPAVYDDTLLRVTRTSTTAVRMAGEVDHSNRHQIRRLLETTLDEALRSHNAATDITLDLSSLRFIDVSGAVALVHAAEEFPSTHRLVLQGVRPRVMRVLDRCGAPFAAQLEVVGRAEDTPPGART